MENIKRACLNANAELLSTLLKAFISEAVVLALKQDKLVINQLKSSNGNFVESVSRGNLLFAYICIYTYVCKY